MFADVIGAPGQFDGRHVAGSGIAHAGSFDARGGKGTCVEERPQGPWIDACFLPGSRVSSLGRIRGEGVLGDKCYVYTEE